MKPISITLRQVDYVIAVAESGSTAAAARRLNVAQPSVSAAVSRVEEVLGQQIFVRAPGLGMELTSFGKRKVGELRRLRAEAQAALSPPDTGGTGAEFDLGVLATLAPTYVPRLLLALRTRFPEVVVRVHEGDLQSLRAWLETGRIEQALIYDFGLPSDLEVTPLRDVRPYGLVAPDHRLAGRRQVSLVELLGDPLILIGLPQSREYFLSLIAGQGVTPRIAFETRSLELLRSMVASGFGVGLLATELPYRQTYDGGEVVHLALAGDVLRHRIALARSARLGITWIGAEFQRLAKDAFTG